MSLLEAISTCFAAAYVVLAVFLPAAGLALRVITGRHFLSDTVFAVLFVLAIALGLHRWLLTERR